MEPRPGHVDAVAERAAGVRIDREVRLVLEGLHGRRLLDDDRRGEAAATVCGARDLDRATDGEPAAAQVERHNAIEDVAARVEADRRIARLRELAARHLTVQPRASAVEAHVVAGDSLCRGGVAVRGELRVVRPGDEVTWVGRVSRDRSLVVRENGAVAVRLHVGAERRGRAAYGRERPANDLVLQS